MSWWTVGRFGFAVFLALAWGGASAGPILDSETKLYSQGNEELVIRDHFQDARDGFFLDVGCAYPRRYSTTYYLEKHLGWTGIGVDAVEKYSAAWARLRPSSKFFQYLVTDHSGTEDTFFVSEYRPISSIHRKLVEHADYEEVKVETITLDELLEKNGIGKIDFLSVDIEGAGLLALRGFDIRKYKPELVCVEPVDDTRGLLSYFDERGYRWRRDLLGHDFGNWYFEPRDRPLVTKRSLPDWIPIGDRDIEFAFDGRELVARVPADRVTDGGRCSSAWYDEFVLDLEVRASDREASAAIGWGTATPFEIDLGPAEPGRWRRVRIAAEEDQTVAWLDGARVASTRREAGSSAGPICLRVGSDAPGFDRAVRWRVLRIGPAEPDAMPAAAPNAPKDILWTEEKQYSYDNEELIIRDFFQDRRHGFFVDIGCAHPRKNSNTYYLEKHLGWAGIGVDAVPDYARGWKKRRPESLFLNFLVTDHSDTQETFYQGVVWGLSTAEKDVAARRHTIKELEVPSITLDDLLERNDVEKLDFLSIDVEGHHAEVLGGFDIERWKPELVGIEEEGLFAIPWFRDRGYEPIVRYRQRDLVNWWFAPAWVAAGVDARRSEVGELAMRARQEMMSKEPMSSPYRTLYTPKVTLDKEGNAVRNPAYDAIERARTDNDS